MILPYLGFLSNVEVEVVLEALHVSVDSLEKFWQAGGWNSQASLEGDNRRLSGCLQPHPEELGQRRRVVVGHVRQGWKNEAVDFAQAGSLRADHL